MSHRSSPRPSSMGRRQTKTADEADVFSKWRFFYRYTQRPGVTSSIKRRARRRERAEAKRELRAQMQHGS